MRVVPFPLLLLFLLNAYLLLHCQRTKWKEGVAVNRSIPLHPLHNASIKVLTERNRQGHEGNNLSRHPSPFTNRLIFYVNSTLDEEEERWMGLRRSP